MAAFLHSLLLLMMLSSVAKSNIYPLKYKEDRDYWFELGRRDMLDVEALKVNNGRAKNVIIFIGDGMGLSVTTSSRIYKGQHRENVSGEEGYLSWERLPHLGLLKTYCADNQVTDSGASATALFCGLKVNFATIGVDASVSVGDCETSMNSSKWLPSIFTWGQAAGKYTGFVTTKAVTDATPAGLYAHTPNRSWFYDAAMEDGNKCNDIAKQLVENETGRNIRVVMGGGRLMMGSELGNSSKRRKDGRNLTQDWLEHYSENDHQAFYVTNKFELQEIDADNTDALIGLFNDGNMFLEHERSVLDISEPSLEDMTAAAIKVLSQNDEGFLLMVEGGNIDTALHRNQPRAVMDEVLAFNEAIEYALQAVNLDETLVIVTSDHSHGMTISGYSDRGNDILGVSKTQSHNGEHFTTLMFATGPGPGSSCMKEKPTLPDVMSDDTRSFEFKSYAAVSTKAGHHAGEDVPVYAIGPKASYFHRVHESSYVAHVISYAACIGPYKANCSTGLSD